MLAQRSGLSSSSEVNDLPVLTQTHDIWKPYFTPKNFEKKNPRLDTESRYRINLYNRDP